jgi:membrane protein YqaA with SNARE-associated domain
MKLVIATLAYSVLSSVVPIFNIEVYLAAMATQISPEDALLLAVTAGFGQAAGKVVWYWSVARSMDMHWLKKRLDTPKRQAQLKKWENRIAGRPWVGGGVTFLSGLVGVPPLLIMGVAGGAVRMNVPLFFGAIWLGRGLQSWLILAGLASAFH